MFDLSLRWAGLAGLLLVGLPAFAATTAGPLPTRAFRDEHAKIKEHLAHVRAQVGSLGPASPEAQRKAAGEIVQFFRNEIVPHAEWEERALYPLVDRLAGGGRHRFTATMRHEHQIVARWTRELAAEAAKPSPDYRVFARRADNLLGLIDAHFEEEEQVLLPLIDHAMTQRQFEAEMGKHGEAHPH